MIPSFGGIKQAVIILGTVEKYLCFVLFLQALGPSKNLNIGKLVTFWSIRD